LGISFFSEEVELPAINQKLTSFWIQEIIKQYYKDVGEINYIFCSDDYLIDVNRQYLNHDYYTDIITFDYTEGNNISGDIFISIERVSENAESYGDGFETELRRVMSHGILHLIGINDQTGEEKREMREAEDKCIMLIKEIEKRLD